MNNYMKPIVSSLKQWVAEYIKNNPGADGKDGVSPTVTTSKSGKVTTITITDASGTKTATINDGADGAKGDTGPQGVPGADGKDAVVDATLTQSGQAADAKATGDVVSQLKGDMTAKADKAALTRTDRRLDALWKLNQGVSYNFETDAAAAYAKQVPSGAKLADIQSVGGKTVVWNQLIDIHNAQNYPHTLTTSGVFFTPNADGTVKITGGFTGTGAAWYNLYEGNLLSGGRKILVFGHGVDTNIRVYDGITYFTTVDSKIITLGSSIVNIFIGITVAEIDTVCKPQIIDLTMLFGAGNEPTSTDDSRIAWIEQYAAAHPEYNAGELVSADVESVKYNDAIVAAVPSTVRALPGYGWSAGNVCNAVERTDAGWQYVQRVGKYVFDGTEDWIVRDVGYCYFTNKHFDNGLQIDNANFLTNVEGEYRTIRVRKDGNGLIVKYRDANVTLTLDEVKSKFSSGKILHYEYETPIITDITGLMNGLLDAIPVEAGGTLTFENAAKLPVPSSVEYAVKLSEVNQ